MKLTSENVHNTFMDCLFKDNENKDDHILVESLMFKIGFNPEHIKKNKQDIIEMLNYLPKNFKEGWSFLKMCEDKDGNLWTGLHKTMNELLALGIAIDKLSFCFPRNVWPSLPGGMPYIMLKD